jgi:hypothetical protein
LTFHISLLEEVSEILLLAKKVERLLKKEYEVEAIINKRKRIQKIKYLIKWKDYLDDKLLWKFRKYLLYSQRKV